MRCYWCAKPEDDHDIYWWWNDEEKICPDCFTIRLMDLFEREKVIREQSARSQDT